MPSFARLLDTLEAFHGPQKATWPTDPFLFLIWWHCGYPASDAACARGWQSLRRLMEINPDGLLSANMDQLAAALRPGGMMPEARGVRLKEISERVRNDFGGDLRTALAGMTVKRVRSELKKFPGIANPGADRIILFAGISPVAAVPSNCVHVLVRVSEGRTSESYTAAYRKSQTIIEAETPAMFEARTRAYLLLKHHGQTLCKHLHPSCAACPVATSCLFAFSRPEAFPQT